MASKKLEPKTYTERFWGGVDRVLQKIFGLQPGWHRDLDIVKNNYQLGLEHLQVGNYRDAEFRLKFLVWLDPQHKEGWFQLARAYIAQSKNLYASRALKKVIALDKNHKDARALLDALHGKGPPPATIVVAEETDPKSLYVIHKESFPIYWKEKEISDMLLTSGTRAFSAGEEGATQPKGMIITRAQFEQAEILTLAVLPSERRKGIAERLVIEAQEALRPAGVRKIFLEVGEDNEAAIALYTKLGYQEMSRRKGYYRQEDGSTTDALVMAKELV